MDNRLIEVNIGTGNLVKYSYDILGRRTKKVDSSKSITNPESTIYVYSGDNILSEYKTIGTGNLIFKKNYINGIGTDTVIAYDVDESTNQGQISFCQNRVLPYSSEFTTYGYTAIVNDCNNIQSSGTGIVTNRYYYHTNQLGSVIALTNSTGTVMQVYSYDSFGKVYISNSGSLTPIENYTGSTYSNSRLYTGREYDKETSLYYLRARYYNANTGKFISRDPIGQNDQINLYTYVRNNPLGYTDRDGKNSKPLTWRDYGKDFIGNEVGYVAAGAYHIADGLSFGYLDDYVGLQNSMNSTNYSLNQRGINQGFNRGWKDGNDAAYLLDIAAVGYVGVQMSASYVAPKVASEGYSSFAKLKASIGPAGAGNAWHHIVEQNASNIQKFGAGAIHNVDNVISIPHEAAGSLHRTITGYYNSIDTELLGNFGITELKTVRNAIKDLNFKEQYDFGINVIQKFGGK